MTAQWIPADALATDWSELDPRNRPRPKSEAVAEYPCTYDLGNNKGRCQEAYFTAEARRFHEDTDHYHLPSDFATVDKREALNEESGTRPRRSRVMWWDK